MYAWVVFQAYPSDNSCHSLCRVRGCLATTLDQSIFSDWGSPHPPIPSPGTPQHQHDQSSHLRGASLRWVLFWFHFRDREIDESPVEKKRHGQNRKVWPGACASPHLLLWCYKAVAKWCFNWMMYEWSCYLEESWRSHKSHHPIGKDLFTWFWMSWRILLFLPANSLTFCKQHIWWHNAVWECKNQIL